MFDNSYEMQQKRKRQEAFAKALSNVNFNKNNSNNNRPFTDSFNQGYSQAGGSGNGLSEAGKMFGSFLANKNSDNESSFDLSSIGSFGKTLFGNLGSKNADSGASIMADTSNGTSFLGKVAPYAGLISGGISAGSEAVKGGSWRDDVPQAFFGIDKEKDSDVMQAFKGAGKGATMGMAFGPIGAVIGGILGLGSSFLDDI